MAKKVRCLECANSMDWSLPTVEVIKANPHLQDTLENYILCGETTKRKNVDHCQYCKHYLHDSDGHRKKSREIYERDLKKIMKESEEHG